VHHMKALKHLANNPRLERLQINGDVREFGHVRTIARAESPASVIQIYCGGAPKELTPRQVRRQLERAPAP
jgi:hypothetical protein